MVTGPGTSDNYNTVTSNLGTQDKERSCKLLMGNKVSEEVQTNEDIEERVSRGGKKRQRRCEDLECVENEENLIEKKDI